MSFVLKFQEMEGMEVRVAEKETCGCINLCLGEAVVDLTGHIHQLPCCIKYNGPCSVSHYFKPNHSGDLALSITLFLLVLSFVVGGFGDFFFLILIFSQ